MPSPPRADPDDARRRRAVRWLLLGAACAWAGSAILARWPGSPETALAAALATQLLFACTALGVASLVPREALPRGLATGASRLRASESVLVVIGFVALSYALGLGIAALEVRETSALGELDRMVATARPEPPSFALAILALGIAPALGEELLFRGLIQQGARAAFGPARAIAISAMGFGVLHLDAVQGPAAVVLGLYLALATEIGASLRPAIACHLVNNALAVLLPGLDASGAGPLPLVVLLLVAVAGAALAVPGWRLARIPPGTP